MQDVVIAGELEAETHGLNYGAMVFRVAPGVTTQPHNHASEETWIVQSGGGFCTIGEDHIGLIPSTHVTVPPDRVHSITNTGSEDLVVLGFWWKKL